MNTLDALKLMVSNFPGGIEVVATRLDKNAETLRKELSGKDAKFKLGDGTAQRISSLCIEENSEECYAYVNAICGPIGKFEPATAAARSSVGLMGCTVGLVSAASQVLADVAAARADGVISDNERKTIERDVSLAIRELQAVLAEVRRENEAAHPALKAV
ncbi:MAG: phage regulatory CII family protein [Pseudomonadota bacterium]